MYKTVIKAALRYSIKRLNAGDATFLLRMASPDCELAFPGDNSWSTQFRPVEKGRQRHVTHRGLPECRAFADRYVAEGIQFVIEDVLVAGPPWNTRIALCVHDYAPGTDGRDRYNNRAVAMLKIRWGRLTRWEDYEDSERVAAWDAVRLSGATPGVALTTA
ncbi:MAG: hypothetical protein JWN62_3083 [Acidimicrobiales bacterium]|nr:hypothetical protein [Acidimicrobiales bacterium]